MASLQIDRRSKLMIGIDLWWLLPILNDSMHYKPWTGFFSSQISSLNSKLATMLLGTILMIFKHRHGADDLIKKVTEKQLKIDSIEICLVIHIWRCQYVSFGSSQSGKGEHLLRGTSPVSDTLLLQSV